MTFVGPSKGFTAVRVTEVMASQILSDCVSNCRVRLTGHAAHVSKEIVVVQIAYVTKVRLALSLCLLCIEVVSARNSLPQFSRELSCIE